MKDLHDLLTAAGHLDAQDVPYVLATVVRVSGSTYRGPGAHMLIAADGTLAGSISGGCVEHDLLQHAQAVQETHQARLITYDTTAEDDILWGMGLGCSGILDVWVEPCPTLPDLLAFLRDTFQRQRFGVVVTVFATEGHTDAHPGQRLLLTREAPPRHNLAPELLALALPDAQAALEVLGDATPPVGQTVTYTLEQGLVHAVLETVAPPQPLVIFGAGNDAQPAAQFAQALGWHVTVVDPREAYALADRFPGASVVHGDYATVLPTLTLTARTVALVMTHNYLHDRLLLTHLLAAPLPYVGLLGPRRRTQRLLTDLAQTTPNLDTAALYSPVGLDVGAETPEEVALSIIAEVQAVLTGRQGGPLRERQGPIHSR